MKFFFPATLRSLIFSHTGFHTDSSTGLFRQFKGFLKQFDFLLNSSGRDFESGGSKTQSTHRIKNEMYSFFDINIYFTHY